MTDRFSITNTLNESASPTLSFEFFPPKDETGWETLKNSVTELQSLSPDFVSITYGAMGSNQDASIAVVEHVAPLIPTIAHLTCIGSKRAQIQALLNKYSVAGVAGILALRGDLPQGLTNFPESDFSYALDLVELVSESTNFEVGVAAFPERHPESSSLDEDVRILLLKQKAGASFAMTQLFFDVRAYTDLVVRARAAGVTIPIVPGVMPIANAKQVLRMAAMSGAHVPNELQIKLETAEDEVVARAIGMEFSAELVRELADAGSPGIHIFTLNHHKAATELVVAAGLA